MNESIKIKIHDIDPFKNHPFQVNNDDSLKELAQSIKDNGLLHPLIVRKKDKTKLLNDIQQHGKVNHELNHKLKVLDNIIADMVSIPAVTKKFKNKYGEDFEFLISELKEISANNKSKKKSLLSTKNFKIDSTLQTMQLEAIKNNISFEVKINGKVSINYMIEELVSATELSTLLCDHIKNAIIAINASKTTFRSICVVIGEINNSYGILFYDSGVEFNLEVLVNIGNKPITSHSDIGGTGYGFMTTYDTLNRTKASLVIEEYELKKYDYTKSVGIIFDNKNEYRILSYRADKIKEADLLNRIVVQNFSQKKGKDK